MKPPSKQPRFQKILPGPEAEDDPLASSIVVPSCHAKARALAEVCAKGGRVLVFEDFQIPIADKNPVYSVTKATRSGCDASKFRTDCFRSCKCPLVGSGFFWARIVSWAEASTRRAMLRASSR